MLSICDNKKELPIVWSLESFGISIRFSFLQDVNASSPIFVTCGGINNLTINELKKAILSIIWSFELLGISTWWRFLQNEKALCLIIVICGR